MDAQEHIDKAIHDYPTLFGKRIDVLNHLFLIFGNGYMWKHGEPIDKMTLPCGDCELDECERRDCGCTCKEPQRVKDDTISKLNVYTRAIDYSSSQHLASLHVKYSMISTIPADVTPSWRIELIWLLDEIISGRSKVRVWEKEYGAELNPIRRAKIIKMALRAQHVNAS